MIEQFKPDCWVVIKDGQIIGTHDEFGHMGGIAAVRYVPADRQLPQIGMRDQPYHDSTPKLSVGNSSFEDWYQAHEKACTGDKQLARDAYAAGMGDPLVTYAHHQPTKT